MPFDHLNDDILFQPPIPVVKGEGQRIPTWGENGDLNRRIVAKLAAITETSREAGVDWTIGREQEFTLIRSRALDYDALRDAKLKEIAPKLEKRLEREKLMPLTHQTFMQNFAAASLDEVFMTDLHLRLDGILQPRFGKGKKGFFDPQGVLEASTVPADPVKDVAQWHAFCNTLSDMAKEYGMSLAFYKRDITLRAADHATGEALFQPRDDGGKGPHLAEGILRAVHDAMPVLMKKKYIADHVDGEKLDMGFGRQHAMRSRGELLELRTNHNPMAGSHPALENLVLLAGAQYGLSRHHGAAYKETMVEARFGDKTIFNSTQNKLFFLEELLNSAQVQENGQLKVPNARLAMKYNPYLQKELHLKEKATLGPWINKIRVEGGQIQWPPAEDISEKPDELRRELAKIHYGERVKVLESPGYTVAFGVGDSGDTQVDQKARMDAAVNLMHNSDLLNETLGAPLARDIVQALAKEHNVDVQAEPKRRRL